MKLFNTAFAFILSSLATLFPCASYAQPDIVKRMEAAALESTKKNPTPQADERLNSALLQPFRELDRTVRSRNFTLGGLAPLQKALIPQLDKLVDATEPLLGLNPREKLDVTRKSLIELEKTVRSAVLSHSKPSEESASLVRKSTVDKMKDLLFSIESLNYMVSVNQTDVAAARTAVLDRYKREATVLQPTVTLAAPANLNVSTEKKKRTLSAFPVLKLPKINLPKIRMTPPSAARENSAAVAGQSRKQIRAAKTESLALTPGLDHLVESDDPFGVPPPPPDVNIVGEAAGEVSLSESVGG